MSGAEPDDLDLTLMLLESVRQVHKTDTCDPAGRSLAIYTCEYHQGFEDGLDRVQRWPDA